MRDIDRFFNYFAKNQVDRIELRSSQPMVITKGDQSQELPKFSFPFKQLIRMVQEIISADQLDEFQANGALEFKHGYNGSDFLVNAVIAGENLNVAIEQVKSEQDSAPSGEQFQVIHNSDFEDKEKLQKPDEPVNLKESSRELFPLQVSSGLTPPFIEKMFSAMLKLRASDLHLYTNRPPFFRINGKLQAMKGAPSVDERGLLRFFQEMTESTFWDRFLEKKELVFSHDVKGLARFRCSFFIDTNGVGGVFRYIPIQVPSLESLGLPKEIENICKLDSGLIVITGPTGSGRSTTLAAMIDWINENKNRNIISLEAPVEFIHENKKSLISQREIGVHFPSFSASFDSLAYSDADVVLVNGVIDKDLLSSIVEGAEKGLLILCSMYSDTAVKVVELMIEQFESYQQERIGIRLSECIKAIVGQRLLNKKENGRIAAIETLIVNKAVSNIIREKKTSMIQNLMQTSQEQGMIVLNDSILEFVKNGVVSSEEGLLQSVDKEGLKSLYESAGIQFNDEGGV